MNYLRKSLQKALALLFIATLFMFSMLGPANAETQADETTVLAMGLNVTLIGTSEEIQELVFILDTLPVVVEYMPTTMYQLPADSLQEWRELQKEQLEKADELIKDRGAENKI